MTKEEDVKKAVQTVLDAFVKINILLNNAGISVHCEVDKATEEEWDQVFATNIKVCFSPANT